MSCGGLQPRTKAWLFAIRAYYAADPEIVELCEFTDELMDRVEGDQNGKRDDTEEIDRDPGSNGSAGADDEWGTGG